MSEKVGIVHWEGRGKAGVGHVSTGTGALRNYPYGYASRFEGGEPGTNPEEILGAAHAACYSMMFSFLCDAVGFETKSIDTKASIQLVQKGGGFVIEHIALSMEARVPNMDQASFQAVAAKAKAECPLSKALAAVPSITLTAVLI